MMSKKKWVYSMLIIALVSAGILFFYKDKDTKSVESPSKSNPVATTIRTSVTTSNQDIVHIGGGISDESERYTTLEQLITSSSYIVRGKIVKLTNKGGVIGVITYADVQIEEVLKGNISLGTPVPIAIRGGILTGKPMEDYIETLSSKERPGFLVNGALPDRVIDMFRDQKLYSVGDEMLLFLEDKPQDNPAPYPYFIVGGEAGHFKIENGTIELHNELNTENTKPYLVPDGQSMDYGKVRQLIVSMGR